MQIFILRFLSLAGMKQLEICINKLKSRSKRRTVLWKVNEQYPRKIIQFLFFSVHGGLGHSCAPEDDFY